MSEPNEHEPQPKRQQRLLPLFALAAALMVFGFYLALRPVQDVVDSAVKKSDGGDAIAAFARVPGDLESDVIGLRLPFQSSARSWKADLRQSTVRVGAADSKALETHIRMTVKDVPVPDQPFTFDRTYEDIEVEVIHNGKPAAGDVPSQVAELVQSVKHRVVYDAHGALVSHTLRSSGGASLKQLLSVIEDAASMLALQTPGEPVNAQEPWRYKAPFSMEDGQETAVSGSFDAENRVMGLDASKRVVIQQVLSGRGVGALKDAAGNKVSLRLNGAGRAVFWFNTDEGLIEKAQLTYDQVSAFGEGGVGVQTSTTLALDRVSNTP